MRSKLSQWFGTLIEKIREKWTELKELPKERKRALLKYGICIVLLAAFLIGLSTLSRLPAVQVAGPPIQTENTPSVSDSEESSSEETKEESSSLAQGDEPCFPKGVTINQVDISGMTAQQAQEAMNAWAKDYSLTLTVNGTSRVYDGDAFGISFAETDWAALIEKCNQEGAQLDLTVESPIVYSEDMLSQVINDFPGANQPAKNARLSYSASSGAFILLKEEAGSKLEMESVREAVRNAILNRETSVEQTVSESELKPEITIDSTQAQNALSYANSLLQVTLTYTYAPEGKAAATETIGKSQIASWLTVDGLSVSISSYQLNRYCENMSDAHSVPGENSGFQATGDYSVDLDVPSGGQYVDVDALYDDIQYCVLNGISGSRNAPYYTSSGSDMSFGGTYVEINLSAQHMWLYKNGVCLVSTDIVSGCVDWGCATPTGVYSIYSMARYATLVGPGYVQPVDYWMAFNGGIGIHDSQWRYSYGGTIYQYDGSHGCINTPYSAVATIYENVSVGTPVIVYGGATTVSPISQSLTGTTSYTVQAGGSAFKLDAKPKYSVGLSYSSSNPAVASVSSDGTVTPKAAGTTTITITTGTLQGYTQATLNVTVQVKSKCEMTGQHTWDAGVVIKEATCEKNGEKKLTCSICGQTMIEVIPAKGHEWDEGTVDVEATCETDGTLIRTCQKCHKTQTEVIPAKGHVWDAGKIKIEPTCSTPGEKEYVCSACDKSRTETLPATNEHHYENGSCTVCGKPEE